MMNPSAMRKLFPDLSRANGRPTGRSTRTRSTCCRTRSARSRSSRRRRPSATTAITSPRSHSRPLAVRPGGGGGRLRPRRDRGDQAARRRRPRGGVRSGDKGRGRDGEELSNFEPGADLIAKATVLAEGTQGRLTGAAIRHFDLGSEDPQQWSSGSGVWRSRSRSTGSSSGLAASLRRQVPGVRRLVHLPDG